IAEKLGFDQSTVSRSLSLLLLAPEVLRAVEAGDLKTTEASTLAGQLPYGPPRPWQQEPDTGQESEERRDEQIQAYHLVLSGATPKRAADRVVTERRARKRAAAEGVQIVDATARFGADHQRHALRSPAEADGAVVAAIDAVQGGLVYYPAEAPPAAPTTTAAGGDKPAAVDSKQRGAAMKSRRAACQRLVATPPPREKLLPLLAAQYAGALTALAASPAGWNLAYELSRSAGLVSSEHPDVATYRAAAAQEVELKRQLEIAWACAVAAYELHASDKARQGWGHTDLAYLQLLQERASYSPTPWECDRISAAVIEGGGA
ncbi:MAG: ParB/RepB/Spo0J family partition protein, partial [[Mycobacterium] stephanolepidis]